jgi:WD40 repeat protein/serine/threonine protein kinase
MSDPSPTLPPSSLSLQEPSEPSECLWQLWRQGQRPSVTGFLAGRPPLSPAQTVAVLLVDQGERWRSGERVPVEVYFRNHPALRDQAEQAVDLIYGEILLREELGEAPGLEEYQGRFPQFTEPLQRQFSFHRLLENDSLEAPPGGTPAETADWAKAIKAASPPPPRQPDWPAPPGFEVLEEVGRGGMGIVYKARQISLNRLAALKMIRAGMPAPLDYLDRLRIEAEAVARLRHPNIVQIYEVDECQGRPFLVFEYVDGGSLAQRLGGKPVPAAQAAVLVEALARAMHCAHQQGIIHRDLKPSNILLTRDSVPKITDFGLAKLLSEDLWPGALDSTPVRPSGDGLAAERKSRRSSDSDRTRTGAILGTPNYMAPEQATGQVDQIGPASDVYALGAILYEMITGRPPFQGTSPLETLFLLQSEEPVSPKRLQPSCPRDLETVCLKCLAREPARRYASALDLADDLHRFQVEEPILARPVPWYERTIKWMKRRPTLAGVLAVSTLVIGLLILVGVWYHLKIATAFYYARELKTQAYLQRDEAEYRLSLVYRYVYLADMHLAHRAWKIGAVRRTLELLEKHRPPPDNPNARDLRGFEWYYLWHLCRGERFALANRPGPISALAFSPNGEGLAVGTLSSQGGKTTGAVWLWDPERVKSARAGPSAEFREGVHPLVFSAGGKALASVDPEGVVKRWDLAQDKPRTLFSGPGGKVLALALAPRGQTLATADEHGEVRLWHMTGRPASTVLRPRDERKVNRLAFSADGQVLAAACQGSPGNPASIVLWNTASLSKRATVSALHGPVRSLALSSDGRLLAAGGGPADGPGEIKVWDTQTGRPRVTLRGHTDPVTVLAFAPAGGQLASGSEDRTIRLWDPEKSRDPVTVLRGHLAPVTTLAFSSDPHALASGDADGAVKVWDLSRPAADSSLRGHTQVVRGLAFGKNNRTLVSVGGKEGGPGERVQWDLRTGAAVKGPAAGSFKAFHCIAFAPDNSVSVTGGEDGLVQVWKTDTGEATVLRGHTGTVNAVAFDKDGRLATAGQDEMVRLWDLTRKQEVVVLGCGSPVLAVSFSLDGKVLAAGCEDGLVRLWDPAEPKLLDTLKGHNGAVTAVVFSPLKLAILVTGGKDRTVRVWDTAADRDQELGVRKERLKGTLKGHGHWVLGLAFSPDGKVLASASRDGTVKLWYPQVGQEEEITLVGDHGWITAVAFSPASDTLAAACQDGTVKVWHAPRPTEGGAAK